MLPKLDEKKLFKKINLKKLNLLRLKNKTSSQFCVNMLVNFIHNRI